MKNKVYVDTNIFIRYFTNEPPEQAEKSRILFNQTIKGDYELFICDLIIAETIYVLESVYQLDKSEIAEKILSIIRLDNVIVENRSIILEALEIYEGNNFDFTDAYLACHARKYSVKKIFSFDNDFKKINFIKLMPDN